MISVVNGIEIFEIHDFIRCFMNTKVYNRNKFAKAISGFWMYQN
ncbi:hypothetical protein SAMN02745751_03128 [Dethiosulfatibacter aminovorans DSM 17477]|uniref:Uncharacterized protein n=1 Tax=Dethiosulfatibacter aminovorans DSM 17477 TaxID=1121476 RepID=A0A1M6LBF6_9FIRM|nr:hypothetical protein SAMN02745751_03128 [Dethiosulfatibacter aminovorans DSM 17477]